MAELLNRLMTDGASALVRDHFTGVDATWWWERRIGGGVEICQELDPERMSQEISDKTGRDPVEVRRAVEAALGEAEPVVLTFEIPGDATVEGAARVLAERSSEPEGLAAGLYRQVEAALESI